MVRRPMPCPPRPRPASRACARWRCSSLAWVACATLPAGAAPPAPEAAWLPKLVTTASRVQATTDQLPASVSVITADDVDRLLPADLKDLLRYQADVSVRAQPNRSSAAFYATGRGGNEGINVRGLEGNQVMLQSDGVRLPMAYTSGPVYAGRADYIDPEAFKRVEILRGPSSTAYGSDGLAGAVSFVTKDPVDLLGRDGRRAASVKLGAASADRSRSLVPGFALREGGFEALLLASLRRGHATESHGDNDAPNNTRTVPNPQRTASDYVLGKLHWRLDARQRLKLSAEHLQRQIDTEVFTLFGDPSYATTTEVDSTERIRRSLGKLAYEFADPRHPWVQRASAALYAQEASNRQLGWEARSNTTAWNSRRRDNLYGERSVGLSAQAESNGGQAITHHLVYGVDASSTLVHSLKDGANLLDGRPVTSGSSAFVPNKSFPDTDYRLLGVFVQDEIGFGRLSVIPGLRFDRFTLSPRQGDALYTVNNAQVPVSLADQAVSPKLGLLWRQSALLQAYAQLAQGFRAPTPTMVNGGVSNLSASQPYLSIGNAALKPERSRALEIGLRGADRSLRYSVSAYRNAYRDFIAANAKVGGSGTAADPTVFQSVNLGEVTIQGLEFSGAWQFAPGWQLQGQLARARGDEGSGAARRPLSTIEPARLVLGLQHERAGQWGAEALLTAVQRHRRNPVASNFTPPGYAVLDLNAWWQFSAATRLNLALYNLGDRHHWHWSDVRDLSAASRTLDAFSQPGRHLALSVRHSF